MRAQEKLDLRNTAILRLRDIDLQLESALGAPPSTRAASAARGLFAKRAKYADRILEFGGQPSALPAEASEAV